MNIPLAHLILVPPDEALSYWFVSHDFAAVLGIEFSRDAATVLRKLLAPYKVRIDYEADTVTLRIARKDSVIPALRALYAHVGWDTAELDDLEPTVRGFRRH
jgi:hypothetical protein